MNATGPRQALRDDGWTLLPVAIDRGLVDALRQELDAAYERHRMLQLRNGTADGTAGTVHHLPCERGAFLELLERDHGQGLLHDFFGGPYILNTYGGVLNRPGDASYVGRVHRDQRTFSGDFRMMAQLLIMLDDFTAENGATHVLPGSHRMPDAPSDELFFGTAVRATGVAGSIVMFDSNLWHAAGANRSSSPRRALTLAFTRPFVKQQLDYPRALGYETADSLSPALRQVLGYNARVPASLDEWYQPPEHRLYKRDQG